MMNTTYRFFADLLFLTSLLQLALCLYEAICHSRMWNRIMDGGIFLALLILTSYVSAVSENEQYPAVFPRSLLLFTSVLTLLRAAALVRMTYRAHKEALSPSSIKQALDHLDSGVLFADATGRTILANYTIVRLAELLMGGYPQSRMDLESALRSPSAESAVVCISKAPALYRFSDGRVWRFESVPLSRADLPGFTQLTAQDVTELYEANASVERENAALQEAIEKMHQMMDRIADRIREQETLNLKMRIHNDIGTSLIALSEMIRSGEGEDFDKQLKTLHFAVSCFTHDRINVPETFEDVYRQAASMGVTLLVDGYIPQNKSVEQLIAAAAGTCVTNCVRHAKGKSVTVKISEHHDICTAKITNDGKVPGSPIVEGDGFLDLRKRVERLGGEMRIYHSPDFMLVISIAEKEPEP